MRLLYEHGFENAFLERRTMGHLARVVLPCIIAGALLAGASATAVLLADVGSDDSERQGLLAAVSFVAFGIGFLIWSIRRQKIGIASWQVVLDGRADAAERAAWQLKSELDRRLRAARVQIDDHQRKQRWALRVRHRTFNCYVSVFPFGTDLFVGWAMLEEPHFWNVFGGWLSDLLRGGTWFTRETRSYIPKALRDVVHNATRDAVATAAATPPVASAAVRGADAGFVDVESTVPSPLPGDPIWSDP
jgi:hypothetical protein